jgi:hypothetical protein
MRRYLLAVAACAASLTIAAPGFARSRTTNQPAIFTIKVTITDAKIAMSPNHAARGSTVTFILTNRGKKTHTFVLGDPVRGPGHGQGFAHKLGPNQQFTLVMYLDYRGVLKYRTISPGGTIAATGAFKVI